MEIIINVAFRNLRGRDDSTQRSEHVLDRMASRGIGKDLIKEAVQKGAKVVRSDGSIVSQFRWFRVIYREFVVEQIKKIYPITVMEA